MPGQLMSECRLNVKLKGLYVVEIREATDITLCTIQIGFRLVDFNSHILNGRTLSYKPNKVSERLSFQI